METKKELLDLYEKYRKAVSNMAGHEAAATLVLAHVIQDEMEVTRKLVSNAAYYEDMKKRVK